MASPIPTFEGVGGPLPHIPDDLTIPQFMFDFVHPLGSLHSRSPVWLIDDATGIQVTSDMIRARTNGLANALHLRYGLGVDDVACVFAPNHIDYPTVIWAALRLGVVVTCANPSYTADELAYQLKITRASVLFVHPTLLTTALEAAKTCSIPTDRIMLFDGQLGGYSTIQDLIMHGLSQPQHYTEHQLQPGEGKTKVAFLLFSSGTTGRPKAVMLSHYGVIATLVMCQTWVTLDLPGKPNLKMHTPGDRVMLALPMFHAYGLVLVLHWQLFAGLTCVVLQKFVFESALQSIERYRITHLLWVPPMLVLLCKMPATKKYDLSSVKVVLTGAAPLGHEVMQQVRQLLPQATVAQGFGLTETGALSCYPPPWKKDSTPGCSGMILTGLKMRILKSDGSWGGLNEPGELVIAGPNIAMGYLNNAEATAETFRDGWVHTGDEAIINEDTEVFIVDRIKELIKVRGFQVAPAELEANLLDHPDVADVCVVGAPDEYSGELPFAYVVLSGAARERIEKGSFDEAAVTRAAILKHVKDHKASYKWLGGLAFVDAVPKTASGKLLRRFLRDGLKADIKAGKIKIVPPTREKEARAKL